MMMMDAALIADAYQVPVAECAQSFAAARH